MAGSHGLTLTGTRIVAGVWEGVLGGAGAEAPALSVTHLGRVLDGLEVRPGAGAEFLVRMPIPARLLHDGVQTFVVSAGDETLAHFTVIAGAATDEDFRAEIDLLRAELDLLKYAFRRHCTEKSG